MIFYEVYDLGTRIISGVIGIAIVTMIVQRGGIIFDGAVLILALLGWREYVSAFSNSNMKIEKFIGGATVLALCLTAFSGNYHLLFPVGLLGILAVLTMCVFRHANFSVLEAAWTIMGICYVGFTFPHLRLLRFIDEGIFVNSPAGEMELGCALIWLAFIGTWSSDTFAYFAGYFFGKHKLCPEVSPKKTIEGFVGGLLGTMTTVAYVGSSIGFEFINMAILGLFVCLVATVGDLVESAIKRYTDIKDSGNLIPGHGGILDRFDSVMFTAPFVYYFAKYVLL